MRGHRAKQYRKLMHQYGLTFGFREPYQVLLDAEIIKDAARFKMDLVPALERTLQGKVKPMITQCCMRHLYLSTPKDESLISSAKRYERRRCNHHELPDPLSAPDCVLAVLDPRGARTNRHRYVVASQDAALRAALRRVAGVPLVYVARSVMILEPMAGASEGARARDERDKFRAGIRGARGPAAAGGAAQVLGKRERGGSEDEDEEGDGEEAQAAGPTQKKKKTKAPNPLSVMKSKKARPVQSQGAAPGTVDEQEKKKRKRRKKTRADAENRDPATVD